MLVLGVLVLLAMLVLLFGDGGVGAGVGSVGAGGRSRKGKTTNFRFFILTHLRAQAPPEPAEVAGMSQVLVHSTGDELMRLLSLHDRITDQTEKRATRKVAPVTQIRFSCNPGFSRIRRVPQYRASSRVGSGGVRNIMDPVGLC